MRERAPRARCRYDPGMVIAIVPALAAVIGLVVWFVASNARVSEAGKLVFFAGMLALLFALMNHTVRIG